MVFMRPRRMRGVTRGARSDKMATSSHCLIFSYMGDAGHAIIHESAGKGWVVERFRTNW